MPVVPELLAMSQGASGAGMISAGPDLLISGVIMVNPSGAGIINITDQPVRPDPAEIIRLLQADGADRQGVCRRAKCRCGEAASCVQEMIPEPMHHNITGPDALIAQSFPAISRTSRRRSLRVIEPPSCQMATSFS